MIVREADELLSAETLTQAPLLIVTLLLLRAS